MKQESNVNAKKMEMIKIKRIYNCKRPKDVNQEEWNDCNICLFARCGYSRCFEPNPKWEKQKGVCIYEYCIEKYGNYRSVQQKVVQYLGIIVLVGKSK